MNFFRNDEFLPQWEHAPETSARKPDVENCEFLTKQEAAAFLNCGVRSIDKWRHQAGLPSVRIGNFVRFERASLIEWMRKHMEVKGMSQQAESQDSVPFGTARSPSTVAGSSGGVEEEMADFRWKH